MASKIQRWLDLLAALLRRNYPVSFEQLIDEVPGYQDPGQQVESRRRMFERDKDELRSFGIPILTQENSDGEVGYQLRRKEFYLPYLMVLEEGRERRLEPTLDKHGYRALPTLAFEPDELRAIEDLAHRLPALGVPSVLEDARSALRKLGATPPAQEEHAGAQALAAVFDELNDALSRRKAVTFRYRSLNSDSHTTRTVHPWGLFFLGHHWYLAGPEAGDTVVKNFRLSRISEAKVNPKRPQTPDHQIPAEFQLREHARSKQAWELGSTDAVEATVAILHANGATRQVARLGEPVEGHADRRRFSVRRLDTFARWLLGFAGMVTPLEPAELVTRYHELARETLARYKAGAA